mmetsp:Transcript_34395/g.42367  ORF Transcript_34395/g.42367 Transcript_34395/m.42367 type:complete len:242 (-) Transcript_34395:437-1162(-)
MLGPAIFAPESLLETRSMGAGILCDRAKVQILPRESRLRLIGQQNSIDHHGPGGLLVIPLVVRVISVTWNDVLPGHEWHTDTHSRSDDGKVMVCTVVALGTAKLFVDHFLVPGLGEVPGLFEVFMDAIPRHFLVVVKINDIDFRALKLFQQQTFRKGSATSSPNIDLRIHQWSHDLRPIAVPVVLPGLGVQTLRFVLDLEDSNNFFQISPSLVAHVWILVVENGLQPLVKGFDGCRILVKI